MESMIRSGKWIKLAYILRTFSLMRFFLAAQWEFSSELEKSATDIEISRSSRAHFRDLRGNIFAVNFDVKRDEGGWCSRRGRGGLFVRNFINISKLIPIPKYPLLKIVKKISFNNYFWTKLS